jgi:TATA-binding protein-associated factor Taf7
MNSSEVEIEIGSKERAFDRARDRLHELEISLRVAENSLDRAIANHSRDRLRSQIARIEKDLASARRDLPTARESLEAAWALRGDAPPVNEGAAKSVGGKA